METLRFGERDQGDDSIAELVEALADRERVICAGQSMDVAVEHQNDWSSPVVSEAPRSPVDRRQLHLGRSGTDRWALQV